MTMGFGRRGFLVLGLASASLFAQAIPASAGNPASGGALATSAATLPVSVVSMIGKNAPVPYIDPALSKFSAQLTKPPLSSFNSYTQLAAQTLATPLGGTATGVLPNKDKIEVALGAKPDANGRYTLHATIGVKTLDLTMPEKRTLFVGGQKYNNNGHEEDLVLAFTVNP
jgi:hypothetical protein